MPVLILLESISLMREYIVYIHCLAIILRTIARRVVSRESDLRSVPYKIGVRLFVKNANIRRCADRKNHNSWMCILSSRRRRGKYKDHK